MGEETTKITNAKDQWMKELDAEDIRLDSIKQSQACLRTFSSQDL